MTILDLLFQDGDQIVHCPHIMIEIAATLDITTADLSTLLGIMHNLHIIRYRWQHDGSMLIIRQ